MLSKTLCILFAFILIINSSFSAEMSKDELKNVKRYTKDLKSKEQSVRYEAAESLQYYKYPEVVVLLSEALKDKSSSVRNRAALSLYEFKEVARPAIPALLQALQDSDAFVRINAGAALLNLDVEESQVLPAIQALLQHPEARIQVAAARFLQGNVPFTDLMPVLSNALKNNDSSVRVDATKEFDRPKELPSSALPILVDALQDPNPEVRKNAASAFDKFKSKGTAALPALIRALKDSDRDVRSEVVDTIASMGTWGKEALPDLSEVIRKDPDPGVRRAALRALEWIDPEGRTVVPVIIEALKDKDPEVRERALDTMTSLRPFPYTSVPAVQSVLASETNERVKRLLERVIERGIREKEYEASGHGGAKVNPGSAPKKAANAMPKEEATRILQEKGVQMTTDEFWRRVNDGDSAVVKAMLSAGFPPNTEQQGMSVMMIAVRFYDGDPEKKEVLKALIDFGADVNYRDQNNTTPFFYAAGKCEPDLLLMMIKAGAILEVQAKGSATTLSEAVMANKVENVRLLLESGYKVKNEPAWLMATAKNPEIAALLRKAGVR